MTVRREMLFAVLLGLVVALIVYAASQTVLYWPFLNIQNKIDDSKFFIRARSAGADTAAVDDIVIVDFDDRSIEILGNIRSKRWPRRHLAKLIGNLQNDGARLIFLDVILQDRTRDNIELADSTRNAGRIIAGYYFRLDSISRKRRPLDAVYNDGLTTRLLKSGTVERNQFVMAKGIELPYYDFVRSVRALGFTNYVPDPDGILRHIPLYIAYGGKGQVVSPSASLQIWLHLNDIHYSEARISPRGIRFGETFIPTDKHCFMRLNFPSPETEYPSVSFADVLAGRFEPGTFTDKIVMIGSSSEKIGDLIRVPGRRIRPGVEIHAIALSTILNGRYLTVVPGDVVLAACVLLGILAALLFNFTHPLKVGLPVAILSPVLLYGLSLLFFLRYSRIVNISVPSFIICLLYIVIAIHRLMEKYDVDHDTPAVPPPAEAGIP